MFFLTDSKTKNSLGPNALFYAETFFKHLSAFSLSARTERFPISTKSLSRSTALTDSGSPVGNVERTAHVRTHARVVRQFIRSACRDVVRVEIETSSDCSAESVVLFIDLLFRSAARRRNRSDSRFVMGRTNDRTADTDPPANTRSESSAFFISRLPPRS